MTPEIRKLTEEHFGERIALSNFAFQLGWTAEQMEERRAAFVPEWEYGLFGEDGRLLSALALLPLEAWIQGRKFAMGGIAGVASWPDARRQGGVNRLLLHAFEEMRRQGQSLSMLHPFEFAFYRKYGYELTIERKSYTLEKRHLPARQETPGSVRIVPKEIGILDPVYQAYASRYDGMLVRDARWWDLRVLSKPGLAAVYYNDARQPEGYLLYEVADRTMKVHDWAALTEAARVALWSYVGNHDSMIDRLTVTVPADDGLPFLVPDPRFKQELEPYFMSRIVDMEAFVRQYPFAAGERMEEIGLRIADAHAPWNQGDFRLRIGPDGTGQLEPWVDAGAMIDVGLSCDIGALTALLVGGRSAVFLHEIERMSGTSETARILDSRVPKQRPYLADFF
jgi:predicted acetyltransferase